MKQGFLKVFFVLLFASFAFFSPFFDAAENVFAQQLYVPPAITGSSTISNSLYNGSISQYNGGTDSTRPADVQFNESNFDPVRWIQIGMEFIMQVWLQAITGIITVVGLAFDAIVEFTLKTDVLTSKGLGGVIETLWGFVRDIANIVIVFSLLYLAIRTILDGEGFADKRKLAGVLLAAILINFSLFFTKSAFMISNYVSLQIRNEITYLAPDSVAGGVNTEIVNDKKGSLSAGVVRALGVPQGIYNISKQGTGSTLDYQRLQFQYLLTLTFSVIGVGFILAAGGLILLYRFVVFIFLIILAPLGLVCFFIPDLKKVGQDWVEKLKTLTIVAPVYFLSFYISMLMLGAIVKLGSVGATGMGVQGTADYFFGIMLQLALQTILIVGTLLATIVLPIKVSAAGSSYIGNVGGWVENKFRAAGNAARRAPVWAAQRGGQAGAAAGAMTGRYLFGNQLAKSVGGRSKESKERLLTLARDGNIAQRAYAKTRLSAAEGLKSKTYDFRNIKGVGKKLGIGEGIVNYETAVKNRKAKLDEQQKKEGKKYGYDDLAKRPENQRKLMQLTAMRDNHQTDLKDAQREYNTAMRDSTVSQAERETKREILRIAQETMEKYEKDVGRQKNIGMQKQYDRMESKWRNHMTPVRREALDRMKKEMEKKFKEDGKAKKQRNGSSTPPPPVP